MAVGQPSPSANVSSHHSDDNAGAAESHRAWRQGRDAALAAVLVTAAVTAAVGVRSPLEPLAERVMESTPVPLANALLDTLGPAAKPFAFWGAAALALSGGALIAWLTRPWPARLALPLAAGAWLVTLTTLLAPSTALGIAVFVVIFIAALGWLRRRAGGAADPGRRRVLVDGVRTIGVVALASLLAPAATAARLALEGRGLGGRLFPFAPPAARKPGYDLSGLTPEVTPLADFYVMSKNVADPVLPAATWTLAVDGRVARPLRLDLPTLLTLPRVDRYVTMQCVSNPVGGRLMSAALFSGATLADVLREAGVGADGYLRFSAPDGHQEGIALAEALAAEALLVYGMNGEWLPAEHGAPLRLLLPGYYGFRSVKWLTRIEVLAASEPGHWETRGWTARTIHPSARVDLADPDGAGESGLTAAGVAFGGRRGVGAVEVRVNGGPWQRAGLHTPPLGETMWVQWRAQLAAVAREARIEARMVDGDGRAQEETAQGQFPAGATGLHGLTRRG
jgi:DMSO/TMAO reductase YedYZ molybdopterin-dependent catalytic subunit